MAFTTSGVNEAPELVPSSFGILSVAKPENAPSEDKWVRGFAQEYNSTVTSLVNWDDTDSNSDPLVSGATVNYYDDIKPFFIEVTEDRSTLGFMGVDRVANLTKKLEAGTQKAIERELSDGLVRFAESHDNKSLSDGATVLNSGTALSLPRAIALLEEQIGSVSHFGEQGVIHVTRDVASLLASNSFILRHNAEEDTLETFGNTPLVVGSGYSGNGPKIAPATASIATNVLTVNTATPHYLSNGDTVKLQLSGTGIGVSLGSYTVASVVDADTFTVALTADDATSTAVTGFVQEVGGVASKWIYGTGTVKVLLGNVDVVNDSLAQGYDVSGNQNDMKLKAIRPAAVYFDTSIHLAVRVDLTA